MLVVPLAVIISAALAKLVVDADEGAAVAVLFGGVEGEGQGPETVGMAVAIALGGDEDVAAFAGLFADAAEVGANQRIQRDAQGAALEGYPKRIGNFLFQLRGENDWLDFDPKLFLRVFN